MCFSKERNIFCQQIQNILPYKRSEYAKKLIDNALESPRMSMIKQSKMPVNKDDLERLFPTGDSTDTIEKIIKLRIQHNRTEVILKAFVGIVHPIAKECFGKIKDYAWTVKVYKNTILLTSLFNVLSGLLKKSSFNAKSRFFSIFKSLKHDSFHKKKKNLASLKILKNFANFLNKKTKKILRFSLSEIKDYCNVENLKRKRLKNILQSKTKNLTKIVFASIKFVLFSQKDCLIKALKFSRNLKRLALTRLQGM